MRQGGGLRMRQGGGLRMRQCGGLRMRQGGGLRMIASCPDPTHKGRWSGYTSPISWASGSAEAL